MLLRNLAHARTGDKGSIITISVIAYRREDFSLLEQQLTPQRVGEHFAGVISAPVTRYALPHLGALNFVLRRPPHQTVTRSLALDTHGKCLSSTLLGIDIAVDEDRCRQPAAQSHA
ncbi:MAG TPA: hypothetical protein VIC54_02225 [Terriglobales bacterium]|jgi:hypothetical protein